MILSYAKAQKAGYSRNARLDVQKMNECVYLSANDFINGKMSYGHNISESKNNFRMHGIAFRNHLRIVNGSSVIKLNKDSIFGYRDRKNGCYRFYKNDVYQILNPSGKFLLYSNTSITGQPKNIHRVTNYFFSENANSPLYPLSKMNLKTVLSKDVNFNVLLDVYFPCDKDLIAFDKVNDSYLLNRIYDLSEQTICRMTHN